MQPFKIVTRFMLGLLLLGAGVYAGILIAYSFGLYPVLKFMPLRDYAVWWNTHDRVTTIREAHYELGLVIMYILTVGMLAIRRRRNAALVIGFSMLLMFGEFYVNHHQQEAINQELHQMDTYRVGDDAIASVRSRTFKVLRTREYLAGISFGLLCMGVSLYGTHKRGQKEPII